MKHYLKLLAVFYLSISFFPLSAQLSLNVRPDTVVCPGSNVKLNSQVTYTPSEMLVSSLVSAGSADNSTISGIATDNSGNYVITGSFSGTLTLGTTTLTSAGGQDIYVAKYNSGHVFQWAVRSGGLQDDGANAITIDANSNIYVAGYFGSASIAFGATTLTNTSAVVGINDIFVARFNPNSNTAVWARKAGGSNNDNVKAIFTNGSGVWLTGSFTGSATFNTTTITANGGASDQDYFVCRFAASNGTFGWVRRAGGGSFDDGYDLVGDGSGNVTVTGKYAGTVQFGTTTAHTVTSVGGTFDIFIARYNNSGTLQWVKSAGGSGTDEGKTITIDGSGNLYVMCATGGPSVFSGTQFNTPAHIVTSLAVSGTQLYARLAIEASNGAINLKAFRKNPVSNQLVAVGEFTGASNTSVLFGEQLFTGISGSKVAFVSNFDLQLNHLSALISTSADAGVEELSFVPSTGVCNIAGTFSTAFTLGNLSVNSAGGADGFVGVINNTFIAPPVYSWTPVGSIFPNNISSPIHYGATSETTFTLTVTAGSESVSNEVTVGVYPLFSDAGTDQSICNGSSATLQANGGVSYSWLPASSLNDANSATPVATPTTTTTYTLTATGFGCNSTDLVVVTVLPNPVINISPSAPVICAGSSVNLTASGASGYVWAHSGSTTASVSVAPLTTTTYTVTGTTENCSTSRTITVVVNPNPVIAINTSPSSTICNGASVTLTASGAATYLWSPTNLTTASITVSPTTNTTYTVTGSQNGCSVTATRTVTVAANPTITTSASISSICQGASSVLSASGASTYTWQPGNLSGSLVQVTPASTTTYTVTGTNAAGCARTATRTITVKQLPLVSINANRTGLCTGQNVTLTASGANSYIWQPGNLNGATRTFTPAATTTYTVTGTTNGCSSTRTITITVSPPTVPVITASSAGAICSGSSVLLSATGAVSYTWMPGNLSGSSVTVSPLVNTTYTVTGNNNGCTTTVTRTITVNGPPNINTQASPATICVGSSTTLTATGANNYTWQPGNLTGNGITVTPASTTTYTVTGSNTITGCVGTHTLLVTVVDTNLSISASANSICSGTNVTLTASGAINYVWQPGNSFSSAYTVAPTTTTTYTVTGNNGVCSKSASITIAVNPPPVLSITSPANVICLGNSITLTASGASSYTWQPGNLSGNTVTVSPTTSTTYTLTGTDVNGCTSTRTKLVSVQSPPVPVTISTSPSTTTICEGSSISLNASWEASSTYSWQPGNLSGQNISVSPTDTMVYTVTQTTNIGCVSTATVQVNVNPKPEISMFANDTQVCSNTQDTLFFVGSNYNSLNVFYNLNLSAYPVTGNSYPLQIYYNSPPGNTYYAIATSINGCQDTTSFTYQVVAPVSISVTEITTNQEYTYFSCTNDTINVQVNTPNGNALWLGDNDTSLLKTLMLSDTVQVYDVSSTDSFGCVSYSAFITGTLNSNAQEFIIHQDTSNLCPGTNVDISHNDITGMYEIMWLPNGSSIIEPYYSNAVNVYVGIVPETLTVRIVPYSCPNDTAWKTFTLNPSIPEEGLIPQIDIPFDTICNDTAHIVTLPTFTQSNIAFVLEYLNYQNNTTRLDTITTGYINTTLLLPGRYILSVSQVFETEDSINSCNYSIADVFWVHDCFDLQLTTSSDTICQGDSVALTASGTGSYLWLPSQQTGSVLNVQPLVTTTYSVIGTEQNGDVDTLSVTVFVKTTPTVSVTGPSAAVCNGTVVQLNATGAGSYTWQPGNSFGNSINITPSASTTYTLTGIDTMNGCIDTARITVVVNPSVVVQATASALSICIGDSIQLAATGATDYVWMPGNFTGAALTISPQITTTYTVTGTSNGCSDTATVHITVNVYPNVTVSGNTNPVCAGTPVALTASGATTYIWQPGNLTGNSVSVIPELNANTFTVTATNIEGCSSQSIFTLSLLSSPTAFISASSNPICAYSTDTITYSAINGTVSLNYFPTSNVGLIGSQPNQNSYFIYDTTTFIAVATSPNGCVDTASVTVNTHPFIPLVVSDNLNNETVYNTCTGFDTLTLSINYQPTSIIWNPSGDTTTIYQLLGADTIIETVVEATDSFGCIQYGSYVYNYQSFDDFIYSVLPATYACPGTQIDLQFPNYFAGTLLIGGEPYPYSTYSEGTGESDLDIVFQLVLSACADTQTIVQHIDVEPPPSNLSVILPFDTLCADTSQPLILSNYATPPGGWFYIYNTQTYTSTYNVDTLVPSLLLPSQYLVIYVIDYYIPYDSNFICSWSKYDTLFVVQDCTPAPRLAVAQNANEMLVAPNPSNGFVRITLPSISGNGTLHLYDNLGRIVLTETVKENSFELDLSQLPVGVYQLIVKDADQVYSEKVIRN
jgi:hypothetical protein